MLLSFTKKLLAGASLLAASAGSFAGDSEFTITEVGSYNFPNQFQNLDLSNVTGARLTISEHESTNGNEPMMIESFEVFFPNANNLLVKDLKQVGQNTYFGQADGAWIYKTVNVQMHMPSGLAPGSDFNAQISIAGTSSNTFTSQAQFTDSEYMLVDIIGKLKNTSDKDLADQVQIIKDGKSLTLSLYANLVLDNYGNPAFDLNVNWLGHGNENSNVVAPISLQDMAQTQAIALSILDQESPDPMVEFKLKHNDGSEVLMTHPLSVLIHSAGL